ncbi:YitT family protein [Clostridium sp. YIM B02515]|uniref:YitT family protein n=1 Tax=Clostridium rhizosphaerae TaxID=2803861 RepID=A0ABS1TEB5_9CLOT|nr:YitT family protein [Clostridium rhizosphaerae]MBL4936308.1 YitT family protein [Clostridium rhizosphaerae]
MKRFRDYFLITVGFLLVAFSLELFLVPNKIAAGGVSGIAIIINSIFPAIDVGLLMLGMNVILFIVAFIVIGNKFGGKSIYASLGLSGSIWLMDKLEVSRFVLTNDLLLASIFGTLLSGIGMAIVFNQNASTGGTDIIAKILNKFFHLDIGKSLLAVDFIVTIFAGVTFGANVAMYALLCVIMNGFVIDNAIEGFNTCKEIMVISTKTSEISRYIIDELERGCTIFNGKGGYSAKNTDILYTVLHRKQFIKLKKFIKEVDSRAFITVSEAHEVLGEGFKDMLGDE